MSLDTIYALASPAGRSGVAVVRLSGVGALEVLKTLAKRDEFKPRRTYLCKLYDPRENSDLMKSPDGLRVIDEALVIYFSAPASFTGEDVVELHPHGSPAVLAALMDVLAAQDGLRLAEPGEFTRRAFEHGKMDLTEAEAVADLIHAQTQLQRAQALEQMGGALSGLYEGWSEQIKRNLAHLEADLEFPDEDMPEGILPQLLPELGALEAQMGAHLDDNHRGEILRDGLQIAVVGAPNAGKSSLVNQLAKRDVAIVSDIAGTTRDVIEVHLDLGGYSVIMADTAGLRPAQIADSEADHHKLEQQGIARALDRARAADMLLVVFDGSANANTDRLDRDSLALCDERALILVNKCDDLGLESSGSVDALARLPEELRDRAFAVSAQSGAGLDDFLQGLIAQIEARYGQRETPSLTRQRHREALESARSYLIAALQGGALPELVAEDLRLALRFIGRITGRVDVEDLLDVIFRDFCIGK